MKLVDSIYVDHQAEIQFPIRYITQNLSIFDEIYLFGSDPENTNLLRQEAEGHPLSDKIRVVNIGVKIEKCGDIAQAQNACIDYLKKNGGFDYVVMQQADILLRQSGLEFISDCCQSGDPKKAVYQLQGRRIRMHVEAPFTNFGCAVMGPDTPNSTFVHDGAYVPKYHQASPKDKFGYMVDVGWIGMEACYRHLSRHRLTWKGPLAKKMGELYLQRGKGDEAFIRGMLRWSEAIDHGSKAPRHLMGMDDPDYVATLEYMKLSSDRRLVEDVFNKFYKK